MLQGTSRQKANECYREQRGRRSNVLQGKSRQEANECKREQTGHEEQSDRAEGATLILHATDKDSTPPWYEKLIGYIKPLGCSRF